jgi:pyrimidine-specific ribonucleoside hydrolase
MNRNKSTLVRRLLSAAAPSLAVFLLLARTALAHSGPPVIIDTDMAADDARALALLLNSPWVNVVGVVATDGVSAPDEGATNLCRILGFLGRDTVAVGIGRKLAKEPPPFRTNATGLDWASIGEPVIPKSGFQPGTNLVSFLLKAEHERVEYIALGPLTTLAGVLAAEPKLANRIQTVWWYGTPNPAAQAAWNGRRDSEAVRVIQASGVRVHAIHWPPDRETPKLDQKLFSELAALESPGSELINRLHSSGLGAELVRQGHLRLWDDLLAVCFLRPDLWPLAPVSEMTNWFQLARIEPGAIQPAILNNLQTFSSRGTVLFNSFPSAPDELLPDVRGAASQIIARHGLEEWKAAALTSELHRHLGTYSIIGAKMGLLARERFNVDLDELKVVSYAGLKPPLSCLNDGLQVATGASLGRGTITVLTREKHECSAEFLYGGRRLVLSLKPEFASRIAADMAALVKKHGGTTPSYFQEVRAVSLRHWLAFDRNVMFDESLGQADYAAP